MKKTNFNTIIECFEELIFNIISLNTTRFKLNKRIEFNHREEVLEVEEVYNVDQTIYTYQYDLYRKMENKQPTHLIFRFMYDSNEKDDNRKYSMKIGNLNYEDVGNNVDLYDGYKSNQLKTLSEIIEAIQLMFYFMKYQRQYNRVEEINQIYKDIMEKSKPKESERDMQEECNSYTDHEKKKVKPRQEATELWSKVLEILKSKLSRPSYQTWILRVQSVCIEGNVLYLEVPDEFARNWMEAQYTDLIQSIIEGISMDKLRPIFILANKSSNCHAI